MFEDSKHEPPHSRIKEDDSFAAEVLEVRDRKGDVEGEGEEDRAGEDGLALLCAGGLALSTSSSTTGA